MGVDFAGRRIDASISRRQDLCQGDGRDPTSMGPCPSSSKKTFVCKKNESNFVQD